MKRQTKKRKQVFLVLHNLRSARNVGSAFRTADTVGVEKIFLTGYTPAPLDRFGRTVKEVSKVALGAESFIKWKKRADVFSLLKELKSEGVFLIAVEQSRLSIDYRKIRRKLPCAFIFGNEIRGLSKNILNYCDVIAEIPIRGRLTRQSKQDGRKESLNVAVSIAVALFRVLGL